MQRIIKDFISRVFLREREKKDRERGGEVFVKKKKIISITANLKGSAR